MSKEKVPEKEKWLVLARGNFEWGRAETLSDALKNCNFAYSKEPEIYVGKEITVDGMGTVECPAPLIKLGKISINDFLTDSQLLEIASEILEKKGNLTLGRKLYDSIDFEEDYEEEVIEDDQ